MSPRTATRTNRRPARATFSDEVRDAIERSGMTPYAVGKHAGVDPGILSRFLASRRGVTSDTLDRLAAALGWHLAAAPRTRGPTRRAGVPVATQAPPADEPGAADLVDPGLA